MQKAAPGDVRIGASWIFPLAGRIRQVPACERGGGPGAGVANRK